MSERVGYPLHLGVTATGAPYGGALKSAVGIGALLLDGIGDTIRVSLTAPACEEVRAAKAILEATGHSRQAYEIISCPTCGRCEVDILTLVRELEAELAASKAKLRRRPLKVAVMGCVVNGPGEAGDADIGIAFGKKEGLLFKNGKAIRKVSPNEAVAILRRQINRLKRS
jgi:(E)-4-hydroxy-3-methylbut-2-enyl-diphosphate synthase